MSTFILRGLKDVVSILIISLTTFTNITSFKEEKINLYNFDFQKTSSITNTIDKYDIIKKYNYLLPYGEERIITDGQDGIYFINSNNKTITIQKKINKIIEVGMGKIGTYNGIITAYGPDCFGCSQVGNVSCRTREGKTHSLKYDGIYYNDYNYSNVRILAADQREFPCGTIVEFKNDYMEEPLIGIVLDTGSDMRKAYENGTIHFDLAFESETNINSVFKTNKNTNFVVKRWGW